jgi:predicted small lipoprotein YifL
MAEQQPTRREVLQKALYVAPLIVTLPAFLSFASAGSGQDGPKGGNDDEKEKPGDKGKDKEKDKYGDKGKDKEKGKQKS